LESPINTVDIFLYAMCAPSGVGYWGNDYLHMIFSNQPAESLRGSALNPEEFP
jgi:hypothetical protein